jgi:poly(3-hydroxybutyrate) depolymerase
VRRPIWVLVAIAAAAGVGVGIWLLTSKPSTPSIRTPVGAKGTGGSEATCSDPSPCTVGSEVARSVDVDDGAGRTVKRPYYVYRPNGLTGRAPLVVLFLSPTIDHAGWRALSASERFVVVYLRGPHEGHWATPTLHTGGRATCGPKGTDICDDIPYVTGVLAQVVCSGRPPCEDIDPRKVFAAGASAGGMMTLDTICDERTSTLLRGASVVSYTLGSKSASVLPYCPMLLGTSDGHGGATGLAPNIDLSINFEYGTNDFICDSTLEPRDCLNTGAVSTTSGNWFFSVPALAGDSHAEARLLGKSLGCPERPTTHTGGETGKVITSVYEPCSAVHRGIESIEVVGGGHAYLGLQGRDGFDASGEAWRFLASH